MITKSIKEFCIENGVTRVSDVRATSENKYPFITLLGTGEGFTKKNPEDQLGAMNVYFSKSTAANVQVGDKPVDALAGLNVAWVEYADDRESRWKFSGSGESYTDASELF